MFGSTYVQEGEKIVLLEDNVNTHSKETLIEVLEEKVGRHIAKKIEWHYTPTHVSWLDQVKSIRLRYNV